jgi:hypothetical protein
MNRNPRADLISELAEEVSKDYAFIVAEAWSMVLNAESRKLSTPKRRSLAIECAAMERAALIVVKNNEYLEERISPEARLKRDKKRYQEAYKAWEEWKRIDA